MVILEFISAVLLIVYVIAENRYLTTVNFELLFAVLSMAMVVLSYLYNNFTSLAISSIVFLLVLIRILRVSKLVAPRPKRAEPQKEGGSRNGGRKNKKDTGAPAG
jgi:membrane protein implicated in regulation of membrane protease activity